MENIGNLLGDYLRVPVWKKISKDKNDRFIYICFIVLCKYKCFNNSFYSVKFSKASIAKLYSKGRVMIF